MSFAVNKTKQILMCVWNQCYANKALSQVDYFEDYDCIERLVFKALSGTDKTNWFLTFSSNEKPVTILKKNTAENGNSTYEDYSVENVEGKLKYIRFFDWDLYGEREYEFIEVIDENKTVYLIKSDNSLAFESE